MQIQRKDNSVECIICQDELMEKYNINMEDIATRSEKTNELMQDICEKTQAFLKIEPPDYIRLQVKIDTANNCVVVVGTSAEKFDSSQRLLSFEPELDESEEEHSDMVPYNGPVGYMFASLNEVMEAARVLPKEMISSCLIKKRGYILVLNEVPEKLSGKISFCMCDFNCRKVLFEDMKEVYAEDILIKEEAIEQLSI